MKTDIIRIGTSGVEMLSEPLRLGVEKAHFTKNLQHLESRIETRPSIVYEDLGVNGVFQGVTHHTPRFGLMADNMSNNPTSIVLVVSGSIYFSIVDCDNLSLSRKMSSPTYTGDTNLFTAEQYVMVVNSNGKTAWHNKGLSFTESKGTDLCSDGTSYEELDYDEHNHFLINNADIGIYAQGRVFLSRTEGCNASFLYASDLVTSKKHAENAELTIMEKQAIDGEGLNTSAHLGKTVALVVMPINNFNGHGVIVDFKERGIAEHNVIIERDTKRAFDESGQIRMTQRGWEEERVTNERLRVISATGRYAVDQLPSDILFGSKFGLHLYKRTLGDGSFNDEPQNNISQDISPLWKQSKDLMRGRSVGYWMEGNRFLSTVGLSENQYSTSPNSRSFVVANKATTYTEDRTGKFIWEGLWQVDNTIGGIHKFLSYGSSICDDNYGFVCSDVNSNIFLGQFTDNVDGYDYRNGVKTPIDITYISGFFAGSGLTQTDKITDGVLEYDYNESTQDIEIYVKSDQHREWSLWKTIKNDTDVKRFRRVNLNAPSKEVESGRYFQFKIKTKGYIKIEGFDFEFSRISNNSTGQEVDVPISCEEEDYYDC